MLTSIVTSLCLKVLTSVCLQLMTSLCLQVVYYNIILIIQNCSCSEGPGIVAPQV